MNKLFQDYELYGQSVFSYIRIEQEKTFIMWDDFMANKLHNIWFVGGRKVAIKPKNKFAIL